MKIPIRVRLALWILKLFCDKFYQCENCPFYKERNERVHSYCIFSHKNPYAVWCYLKKR